MSDVRDKQVDAGVLRNVVEDLSKEAGGAISGGGFALEHFGANEITFGTTSGTLSCDHSAAHNFHVVANGDILIDLTPAPGAGEAAGVRIEIDNSGGHNVNYIADAAVVFADAAEGVPTDVGIVACSYSAERARWEIRVADDELGAI